MSHAFVSSRQRNRAKSLRQVMTRAETLLWRYLKTHHIDELGFRRQVPMGRFIADFICHSAGLVIELDGETHDFQSRQCNDEERDAWFKLQGYRVLRFTNKQVLGNLEGVVETIRMAAQRQKLVHFVSLNQTAASRHDPPSPSLPHKGEGSTLVAPRRAKPRRFPA